jgi:hypothetical protein
MDGIKMKSNALSKFTPDWRAAAILLALAGTSNVRAIPIKHRPYHILAGRKDIPLHLVVKAVSDVQQDGNQWPCEAEELSKKNSISHKHISPRAGVFNSRATISHKETRNVR